MSAPLRHLQRLLHLSSIELFTMSQPSSADWLSHRPEIRVLDCTIRDGGLMNNHHFEDHVVKAVYDACVAKWAAPSLTST